MPASCPTARQSRSGDGFVALCCVLLQDERAASTKGRGKPDCVTWRLLLIEIARRIGVAAVSVKSGLRACLVLDGLEVFSQRALARASSLLELLGPEPSLHGWTVLVTTRPQTVESAHRLIVRAGIVSGSTDPIYVRPLSDSECSQVLKTCRGRVHSDTGRLASRTGEWRLHRPRSPRTPHRPL